MCLVSECCYRYALGDTGTDYSTGVPVHYGRCSKCKEMAVFEDADTLCVECGHFRPDDERVLAGMKCSFCAYPSPTPLDRDVA